MSLLLSIYEFIYFSKVKKLNSFNNILQPTKINSTVPIAECQQTPTKIIPEEFKTPTTNPLQIDFSEFESLKFDSLTPLSPTTNSYDSPQPTQLQNIDLSFFENSTSTEKQPYNPSITPNVSKTSLSLENGSSIKVKNNMITGISSNKTTNKDATSKMYLDSLLADIFNKNVKPQMTSENSSNSSRKDEDYSFEKKCDLTSLF